MTKYFLVFFGLYIYFYLSNLYSFNKKKSNFELILSKFNKVMQKSSQLNHRLSYKEDDELKQQMRTIILDDLYCDMPLISSLLSYNYDSFSLQDDAIDTINKFYSFYDGLHKRYNHLEFHRSTSLDPIKPLKKIFLIPSKILSWFGIELNEIPARVFSLISFAIIFIWKNYGTAIFEWLLTLFK